jgi:hypothetical protein
VLKYTPGFSLPVLSRSFAPSLFTGSIACYHGKKDQTLLKAASMLPDTIRDGHVI